MGRFFNDEKALAAEMEKGEAAARVGLDEKSFASTSATQLKFVVKLGTLLKGMVWGYGEFTGKRVLELTDALEKRIQELEKHPFAYEGPHEATKVYDKDTFVTYDGSLWHCNYKTTSRPGDGPAWTLAVKRGRDGRDTR